MSLEAPVSVVLAAVAQEIRRGSDQARQVEGLVSELVRRSSGEDRRLAMHEAQAIDVLLQQLDVLAAFVSELTTLGADDMMEVDRALGTVSMAEMASRLRRALYVETRDAAAAAPSGDLELF